MTPFRSDDKFCWQVKKPFFHVGARLFSCFLERRPTSKWPYTGRYRGFPLPLLRSSDPYTCGASDRTRYKGESGFASSRIDEIIVFISRSFASMALTHSLRSDPVIKPAALRLFPSLDSSNTTGYFSTWLSVVFWQYRVVQVSVYFVSTVGVEHS